MNLKTLTFHYRLFFILISVLGVSYLIFLLFFIPKIYSGFLMQMIFLTNVAVVHPQNVLPLVFRSDFLIQIVTGFIWSYLLFRAVKAFLKTIGQIRETHKFVQSLNIIKTTELYYIFKSSAPEVFTVGFFHPQIYLSQKLLKISNQNELSSILYHEQSHALYLDPLKNMFVGFIDGLLPVFPLKSWLFGQYLTLVEVYADAYSFSRFLHPHSLVSALLKIQNFAPPSFVSGFSAQSERIKILTGHKSPPFRSVVFSNVALIVLLFVVSGSLYNTKVFYQCSHLLKCFENLVTPDHIIINNSIESHHCFY